MKTDRFPMILAVCAAWFLFGGCSQSVQMSVSDSAGYEIAADGVIFRYFDPDASKVSVVGDFNNWTPAVDQMVDKNGDGHWTLFFPLTPGTYQYKFIIDGSYWIADPRNPQTVSDGFEGGNSVLVFPVPR